MTEPERGRFDAIVVGAGLMGSAAAWSLARRGRAVLLVERHTPANPHGSSHGSARIVRRAYADPLYTQLTGRAFELWRELELQSGAKLLRMLGGLVRLPPLTVTQQQVFHFPRRDASAEPWPSVIHHDAQIYHLAGGRDGGPAEDRKIAEHRHGTPTSASGRSGIVATESRARIVEYVQRWLPGLDPTPGRETTCLYTSTPNEDFVLDRVGALVVCSPCSGHGAKFAPLIGELTADLVTAPASADIPRRFRLASHAAGSPVQSFSRASPG